MHKVIQFLVFIRGGVTPGKGRGVVVGFHSIEVNITLGAKADDIGAHILMHGFREAIGAAKCRRPRGLRDAIEIPR